MRPALFRFPAGFAVGGLVALRIHPRNLQMLCVIGRSFFLFVNVNLKVSHTITWDKQRLHLNYELELNMIVQFLAMRSLTRSLQSMWFPVPVDYIETVMEIATNSLN